VVATQGTAIALSQPTVCFFVGLHKRSVAGVVVMQGTAIALSQPTVWFFVGLHKRSVAGIT